jgi:hypothetical protein
MNERINTIQIQTMSIVMNGSDPDKDVDKMYIPAEFTKKFAELIVQECAEQIIEKGRDYIDFAPSLTGIRPEYWEMSQHIKQHFGIHQQT